MARTQDARLHPPPGRVLLLSVPAGLVGFFEELAQQLAAGVPDAEVREALSKKYDSLPVE